MMKTWNDICLFNPPKEKTTVDKIFREKDRIPPKVMITMDALLKMKTFVDLCSDEVGWLGLCKKDGEKGYLIYEVELIKQKVSAVTTDLDENGLQEYANKLMSEGRFEALNDVRVWGHSHVEMQTNPSGTDDETFEELYKECEYFIRIIANKKGHLRLDIAECDRGVVFYDVQWKIKWPTEIEKEITETSERMELVYNKLQSAIEEIKPDTEKEIAQTVKKNFVCHKGGKSYKVPDYSKYYGYDEYDMYQSYYGSYADAWEDDALMYDERNDFPIKVVGGELNVFDVLMDEQIVEIAESPLGTIRKDYADCIEFEGYKKADWRKLKETCQQAAELIMLDPAI